MKLTSLCVYKEKMEAQISPLLKAFDYMIWISWFFLRTWKFYMPEAKKK